MRGSEQPGSLRATRKVDFWSLVAFDAFWPYIGLKGCRIVCFVIFWWFSYLPCGSAYLWLLLAAFCVRLPFWLPLRCLSCLRFPCFCGCFLCLGGVFIVAQSLFGVLRFDLKYSSRRRLFRNIMLSSVILYHEMCGTGPPTHDIARSVGGGLSHREVG